MLRDNEKFYLPNLHHFQNDNTFYGSFQGLRFRVKSEQEDAEGKHWFMATLCWYGDYCLEESDVVDTARFPMTPEGYDQVLDWLEGQYRAMLERQKPEAPEPTTKS